MLIMEDRSESKLEPYLSGVISSDTEEVPQRSLGVTVIAILSFALAVYDLARFIDLLSNDKYGFAWILGWIWILIIAVLLAISFGLWRLQSWARDLAIRLYGMFALLAVLIDFAWPPSLTVVVGVAIYAGIILYLLVPRVANKFR